MQPVSLSPGENDGWADVLGQVPELPSPRQRWTARRKATIIEAVRGGWVPIEEVVQLYTISVDEFLAWERDIDRHGVYGLRTTRYQIYRDTEMRRAAGPMTRARTLSERLALSILAREGIAAIWQLHLAAAEAHRTGHPRAAISILEIADAAEDAWLRAEGVREFAV